MKNNNTETFDFMNEDEIFSDESISKERNKDKVVVTVKEDKIIISFPYELNEKFRKIFSRIFFNKEEKVYECKNNDSNIIKAKSFLNEIKNTEYQFSTNIYDVQEKPELTKEDLINEKSKRAKQSNSGVVSVFEQDSAKEQTIEDFMCNAFEDRIYMNENTRSLHVYDEKTGVFIPCSQEVLAGYVAVEMDKYNLEGWKKESKYVSCAKSIYSKIITQEEKRVLFSKNHIAVNIKHGVIEFAAHISFDIVNGKSKIVVKKPSKEHLCYTRMYISLSSSKIKSFNIDCFKEGKTFEYSPADLRNSGDNSLLKYYLVNSLVDAEHLDLLSMHLGALIASFSVQMALVNIGDGGDGKTQILKLLAALFGSTYHPFDISSEYTFNTMGLLNKRLLAVSEVKSGYANESLMKNIIGDDGITVHVKNREALSNFDTSDLNIFVCANDVWKAQDQGNSTERRYNFAQWIKRFNHVIPDLYKKIIIGGVWKDHEGKLYKSEPELELFFDFILLGLIKIEETQGECLAKKNLSKSVKDFNNKMFTKMIATKDFFQEMEIEYSEIKGTSKDDMFKVYNEYLVDNGYKAVGKNKFYTAFEAECAKNFGFKLDDDVRGVKNKSRVRCYPVIIKSDNRYTIDLLKADKSINNVVSINEKKALEQIGLNSIIEVEVVDDISQMPF